MSLPTHCRTVPACNRGYDNCCLTEISHRRHSYMISRLVTLFWQPVNQFLRWTALYMSSNKFDKGASTTHLKSLVWGQRQLKINKTTYRLKMILSFQNSNSRHNYRTLCFSQNSLKDQQDTQTIYHTPFNLQNVYVVLVLEGGGEPRKWKCT